MQNTASPDQIDWDAIDSLYDNARDADVTGDTDRAIALYRQILGADPDDHLGVSLRLARLTGEPLKNAPSAYVATLFDQHADVFETILVDELGYTVPLLIAEALRDLKLGPFPTFLDLGCGTGLCATALETLTETRTGIDLAPTMVEIADELELYQNLYTGDAVAFLSSEEASGPYDLITAADVLPYLGDLEPLFVGLKAQTKEGSVIALSSESHDGPEPFLVGEHKRFAHSPTYLTKLCDRHGWTIQQRDAITVRLEQDEPVPGELIIARRD
ncbi:MAG: methyltransferase [Pseudomonadota bacterium]